MLFFWRIEWDDKNNCAQWRWCVCASLGHRKSDNEVEMWTHLSQKWRKTPVGICLDFLL
jgi:hypothetical protein